jgi:hypothetical protein
MTEYVTSIFRVEKCVEGGIGSVVQGARICGSLISTGGGGGQISNLHQTSHTCALKMGRELPPKRRYRRLHGVTAQRTRGPQSASSCNAYNSIRRRRAVPVYRAEARREAVLATLRRWICLCWDKTVARLTWLLR